MTLVVSLLMAPAAIYLANRFFIVGKQFWNGSALKIAMPVILFSFYAFPVSGLIDFFSTGYIDVLKYPKPLVYWFWFGLIVTFQLATWVLIADLLKLVGRYFAEQKDRIASFHSRAVLMLFVVIFCYTGWKIYHDTTQIKTQQISLSVADLAEDLHNFKIVHISDIQGDEYTGRAEIARYIQEVNKHNADLVIFTGDLISYGTDFIKQSAEEFGKVDARHGTLAILGDHDYWAGVQFVERALQNENIPLLQDENHTIEVGKAASVVVTGVTEVYSKASDPQVVDSLTTCAKEGALKIFASHQVDGHIIKSSQQQGYDLLLAGHTHGGQVHVPFMGMSFSASERETKFISGLYREEGLPINVNNGLGFTLAPVRYNAPPNISVITLMPE